MLSAHESYSMDDISYHNLINCLESMTPFEAIRQAEEINKVNGFEVVSKVVIAGWKRKSVNHFRKIEIGQGESHQRKNWEIEIDFFHSQNEKIKSEKFDPTPHSISKNSKYGTKSTSVYQYQKAYMKLLS